VSVRGEFLRCLGEYARVAEESGISRIAVPREALPGAFAPTFGSLEAALPELRRLGAEGDLELAAARTRDLLRRIAEGLPPGSGPAAGEGRRREQQLREHLEAVCRVILGEPPAQAPERSGTSTP